MVTRIFKNCELYLNIRIMFALRIDRMERNFRRLCKVVQKGERTVNRSFWKSFKDWKDSWKGYGEKYVEVNVEELE